MCARLCVCAWSDEINSGLAGPVGSCSEQETGADMAAWCTRRLKWDETTWPPEEPIKYTKSPATVKLWTARRGMPDRQKPLGPKFFHASARMRKEDGGEVNWAKKREGCKCFSAWRLNGHSNEADRVLFHKQRDRERLTASGRVFNMALPESIVEPQKRW